MLQQPASRALLGSACAILATVIWSGNFIVARGLAETVPPVTLALLRWSTACAALLPFALPRLWKERAAIRKSLGYLVPTSLLGVTVFNTLIYIAGRSTDALNLSLIATSSPLFIVILSRIFLGEPITYARLGGLAAAVAGITVLVTKGDLSLLTALSFRTGDLWMLLAALIFAAYSILIRRRPAELGQTALLGSTFLIGLAFLLPWAAWEHAAGAGWTLTPAIAGAVAYIGIGASLCAYFLWNVAISSIGPAQAALIYYSLPAFSGLEAFLILGERITWAHGAGFVLIVGGILIATRR